jgi:Effector Associated Constant Component 1
MSEIPGGPAAGQAGDQTTALTVTLTGAGLDELLTLRAWLVHEDELRGRVALLQETGTGTLGGAMEALSVSLGSGGAISVLVAGTLSWFRQRYRHRPGNTVTIKFSRGDGGSFEISADAVGTWTYAEFTERICQLAEALGSGDAPPGSANQPL